MGHEHSSKVLEFGFDKNMNYKATLYGCTKCNETSLVPFPHIELEQIDHSNCGDECFGCKAKSLQLATGDARGDVIASGTTNKKWNNELQAYRDARKEGIQPGGTSMKHIQDAKTASDNMGSAYNANDMMKASKIDKKAANTFRQLKEAGA
jgi:hypothetical protein